MGNGANNRCRIVAALAVLRLGKDASSLADYTSVDDAAIIRNLIGVYSREDDCRARMRQLIRQIEVSESFSTLAEVHPAWILEKLLAEPPRVVGIILRSLPSKHVRYILKNLPPMLVAQIPNVIESFSVAGPVLDVIRSRFERHFLPMRVSRITDNFGFEKLYYLKGEDLGELIREVGLTELGIALSGMSGKTLHLVFNRLSLNDAKRLQRRMKELGRISPELFRQSRYNILDVGGEHIGPDRMLVRIGITAIAAAIGEGDDMLVKLLMQKMEPAEAHLLKRAVAEKRLHLNPAIIAQRQDLILKLVSTLSKEGRIDPSLSSYLLKEEVSYDGDKGVTTASTEEEITLTVRKELVDEIAPQLA